MDVNDFFNHINKNLSDKYKATNLTLDSGDPSWDYFYVNDIRYNDYAVVAYPKHYEIDHQTIWNNLLDKIATFFNTPLKGRKQAK